MQSRRNLVLCLTGLITLSLAWHGRHLADGGWRGARGYEFEWIAEPLSKGFGYSFAYNGGWLGPYDDPAPPTAWVEPVQTSLMALAFRFMGESGRLPVVLLNYVWFAISCLLVFEIGRRVGSVAGGFAAAIGLAAFPPGKNELQWYLGNSALATVLMCGVALGLLRLLERGSWQRSVALGLLLGALVLTHAGTTLWVPFAAAIAIVAADEGARRFQWGRGAAVLLSAGVVVLPWSLRNYSAFGEVVPVRTGLGQNMHYALPALAQTIHPDIDLGAEWPPPPWTARNAREAVSLILNTQRWRALKDHSLAAGRLAGPSDHNVLNEAQRDRVLRDQSLDFIRAHPSVAMRLGVAKAYGFFWGNWPGFQIVTVFALVGVFIARRRRSAWIICGLIALYLVPYLLSAPIYYRYRAPIEPLMFALCSIPAASCLAWIVARVRAPTPIVAQRPAAP